jgi:uncharacterized protein (TIGR02099 family)
MQSSKRSTAAGTLLRALEIVAWSALFLFAALFLALRFWVLPQIDRYQPEVVRALERAIGLPVTVGALRADWNGLHPRLTVTDLRVFDRYGREALVLPSVEPVVGWTTLLALELRLHSLAIDEPRLTVRRSADGVISVGGLALAAGGSGGGGLTDWILGQREIVVRNAEVEWIDEQRGAPPLALRSLQFRLRNRGEVHRIGLSARPPRELGAALELRASLIGRSVTQPAAWNGRVYAELGETDLAGWRTWLDYPVEVTSGQGALRLWATFGAGKLVDATADLALTDVAARLGRDLPELRVQRVAGRVQGRETARGYEFGAQGLTLEPVEGPGMHAASFRAHWEAAEPPRGEFAAERIELEPLAWLAAYLPFPADLRHLLDDLRPRGRVSDASFEWRGTLPDEASFRARARFEALGMRAWRRVPGFANLSGRVDASEAKGTVSLASHDAEVDLPRVFAEPRVHLDALSGEVSWERRAGGGVNVRTAGLQFANDDAAGTASGNYAYTGSGPGVIDLSAQLARADAGALPRYLPLPTIVGGRAREWLVQSILAGQSPDTRLRLRGDLRHFPFVDPKRGEFEVVAQVRGGVLAYAEDWPAVEDIEGELRFAADRMEVHARSARVLGAQVGPTLAAMRLRAPAVLTVDGSAQGPTREFLRFIARSPLRLTLGEAAEGVRADGRGELRLALKLPIGELERFEGSGEYSFAGNGVRIGTRLPPIEEAAGRIAFTRDAIQVRSASGRFAGGPLRVIGGTQRDGAVVLSLGGRFDVAALEPLLPEPWRGQLSGAADYAGSVRLRRGAAPQIALESALAGIESRLPPPLAKAPAESQLLRVALLQGEDGARDRVSVTLGRLLRAEFLRRRQGEDMQLERSTIAFYPPPGARLRFPERPARTLLYGSLPHLDLDRWLALLGRARGDAEPGAARADMSFGALDAFGRRLQDISVDAHLAEGGWAATVTSKDIAGEFQFRGGAEAKLTARMTRFEVPPAAPAAEATGAAPELPDVDFVSEEFGYRGKRFGRVEILARHEGPEWLIERLSMTSPEGTLSGKGLWRTAPEPRTTLDLSMQATDVGRYLERVGYPGLVRGGAARLSASLAWEGAPTAIDLPSLGGEVRLDAESGRFLEIDAGVGKLVSLMSLQMLPRRVVLDFRDVFSQGFEWDRIGATARIEGGVLETRDFRMTGSAADVRMQGTVDLAQETQDLRVRVVPEVGSAASTVAGVLVNPAVGLGTLLAQKILRDPLGQMFAFEYGITGGWADPRVEKLAAAPVEPPKPPVGD